jgi:hypothetical protein
LLQAKQPLLLLDEPAAQSPTPDNRADAVSIVLPRHVAQQGVRMGRRQPARPEPGLGPADHVVLLDGRGGAAAGIRSTMRRRPASGAAFGVGIRQVAVGEQQRFLERLRPTEPEA